MCINYIKRERNPMNQKNSIHFSLEYLAIALHFRKAKKKCLDFIMTESASCIIYTINIAKHATHR